MTHHVNVVNLIPKSLSGETNQDSEPRSPSIRTIRISLWPRPLRPSRDPTRLTMFRPTEARLGR
jgi:hypothetical protein